jgi:hypothetical protein
MTWQTEIEHAQMLSSQGINSESTIPADHFMASTTSSLKEITGILSATQLVSHHDNSPCIQHSLSSSFSQETKLQ